MRELEFKEITNVKISSRIRQVVVLVVIILLGIMLSVSAEARPPRHKVIKAKSGCHQLARKRNQTENIRVSIKKVNYKPMAEMEAPAAYRVSARRDALEKTVKR